MSLYHDIVMMSWCHYEIKSSLWCHPIVMTSLHHGIIMLWHHYILTLWCHYSRARLLKFFCNDNFELKSRENQYCRVDIGESKSCNCLYQRVFLIMTSLGFALIIWPPRLKSLKIRLDLSQNKQISPIRTKLEFEIDNMAWNKQYMRE